MTTECSSTANSITEVLLAGDTILNLTQQPLNAIAGTQFLSAEGDQLRCSQTPSMVQWRYPLAFSLSTVLSQAMARVVVVSDENCSDANFVVRELAARHIPHLHCTLLSACDADDFMDEQDTEAVAERLRQLGYI